MIDFSHFCYTSWDLLMDSQWPKMYFYLNFHISWQRIKPPQIDRPTKIQGQKIAIGLPNNRSENFYRANPVKTNRVSTISD